MSRFEIDLYCEDTYKKLHGFPENTYLYDTEEEVIKCISDLIKNKQSGIYKCEITLNNIVEENESLKCYAADIAKLITKAEQILSDNKPEERSKYDYRRYKEI